MEKNKALRKLSQKFVLVIILLLYCLASFLLMKVAKSSNFIEFFGNKVPVAAFSGVFSSIANMCIIFMVVFLRKTGFFVAVVLLLFQFPPLLIDVFIRKRVTGAPGIFSNIFTVIAVIIIYINDRRLDNYQKKIEKQAVTDTLTGIPNRFACTEYIDSLVKAGSKFAVVSIGINNFKNINDTMGYEVGNKVLKKISELLNNLTESRKDITDDYVARITGGEYCLVINGYKNSSEIIDAINVYKAELEKSITVDECDYYMIACFGYAEYPVDADNGIDLLSYADTAMHELKKFNGSESIMHFEPELVNSEKTLEIERKIRAALGKDEVLFHLQPQFDINHKLRGFEALARLKDSDGKYISPADFIPVAEKIGLVDRIDMCVFRKAAFFLKDVLKKKDIDITIGFNVSVRHLMKNNFIEEIKDILTSCGVPSKYFEIEITESVMIDSIEKALQRVTEIKNLGMKLAIDDFGTGYSSLSYLNKFPADLLKVDKSFIDVMNSSDSSKQYVASIISIGHVLKFEVISEGVESPAQLETLQKIGCNYIQGYLWGKPLPPEEAEKLILSS